MTHLSHKRQTYASTHTWNFKHRNEIEERHSGNEFQTDNKLLKEVNSKTEERVAIK